MPDLGSLERSLYKWQQLSHACINCGKPLGGKWTMRLSGHCPFAEKQVVVQVRSDTFLGLFMKLLLDEGLLASIKMMEERVP